MWRTLKTLLTPARLSWPEYLVLALAVLLMVWSAWWGRLITGEALTPYFAGMLIYMVVARLLTGPWDETVAGRPGMRRKPWVQTLVYAGWSVITFLVAAAVRL